MRLCNMNALLLVHIPTIIALAWATWRTANRGTRNDVAALATCGTIVIANSVMRHFSFEGYAMPDSVVIMQQILSALIIPLAYIFIAMQVNVKVASGTTTLLFSLIAFLLFPNISIITNDHSTIDAGTLDGCRTFCIVADRIYRYTISDMIMTLQAIITTVRIAPLFRKLRAYGLQPSRDVKVFTAWWTLTAAFVVFSSVNSDTTKVNPAINAFCHICFMVLVVGIFYLLGRGIDFQPKLIGNSHASDTFTAKSKEMGQQLMTLVNEEHIHLQKGYMVDDAIDKLNTNRTYFYRMLREEFGCTFSELMNRERVKHIKHLLMSTDDSISTIADACGFKNTSYMIKVFKQLEGRTPSEWKKLHTIQNS